MKGGLSRTPSRKPSRILTGIDENRKVSKLRKLFEPKKTQKKGINNARKKSESRAFQSLEEPIVITNKNCPNLFYMSIRKVYQPQVEGHKYTLIITKEGDYHSCKIPLVVVGNKLQVIGIKSDSDCAKNEEDIKKLIEHINIELNNRGDKDMFSSMQELEDFLTLQIKTFCPAGIYRNSGSLRYEQKKDTAMPPKVPTNRMRVKPRTVPIRSELSNENIVNLILKTEASPVVAVLDASTRSSVKIPKRFSPKIKNIATRLLALSSEVTLSSWSSYSSVREPIYQNLLSNESSKPLGLMSEKGSKQKMIKDRLNKLLLYENAEKTKLLSVRTKQNKELYDAIKSLKQDTAIRVKGFFPVIEKFYKEKGDMGRFLTELNDIAAEQKTKESREKREYGHKLILKFGKNEELFIKIKSKFDRIIKDLEIGFRESKTYEDLIINSLFLVSIYTNEFISFIVNNYYFDFIELTKMGFFNEERASKYSKIMEELKYGNNSITSLINGRVQQSGLNNAQLFVNTLFKQFSKEKYEIENKENILEEIKFVNSIFDERVNFFQDAAACIKKTIVKVKDGISSYKEKRFVNKKYVDVKIDIIDELKSCVEQQMVTSDTKDELCNELKKSKGLLKKRSKKNRFRQKAYDTVCKNEESIKTKKNLLKTIKKPLNFFTRRRSKKV